MVKKFVDKSFNRSVYKNVSFEDFSKMYDARLFERVGGIEVVYKELTGKDAVKTPKQKQNVGETTGGDQ